MEANNKLIAEFMGNPTIFNTIHDATLYQVKEQSNMTYHVDELQYHKSWDWLIPVMKKIDSYANEEMSFAEFDDYRNIYFFISDISLHNDISDVYNQVVQFIKDQNN